MKFFLHRKPFNQGQGLVEYGLILALVAVIVIIGVTLFGKGIEEDYDDVVLALGGTLSEGNQSSYCSSEMDNLDDWGLAGAGKDGWFVENGQLCKESSGSSSYAYSGCTQTESMINTSDYVVTITGVTMTQGDGYGIMFRLQDYDGNPNGYIFQLDPGLHGLVFRKWVNGWEVWQPLSYIKIEDYEWYNTPRDVTIKVEGNMMSAYIDQELVLTATDDTYDAGGAGLRTWDSTNVCFDDFNVGAISD